MDSKQCWDNHYKKQIEIEKEIEFYRLKHLKEEELTKEEKELLKKEYFKNE